MAGKRVEVLYGEEKATKTFLGGDEGGKKYLILSPWWCDPG